MNIYGRLKGDYVFRTKLLSSLSFAVNTAYAVYNGVYGFIYNSFWFISLFVYYLILSLTRGGIIIKIIRQKPESGSGLSGLRIFLAAGIMLLILSVALSGAVVMMNIEGRVFEHAGMLIYAAAFYTFYKITASIINIVRTRKHGDFSLLALRNIGLADSLVSVLALQSAMFAAFGGGADVSWANAALGAAVCVLTIALGAFMMVYAILKLKKERKNPDAG